MRSRDFSNTVCAIVKKDKITYFEAILHVCEQNGLEVETAAKLCNRDLKRKMSEQAKSLRLLKR